ncbi:MULTISPECIES: hypothetical protein [Pseudomonas]|uniref:hypothetical protein n=1 Tax=Pseudomonas shirazica TaxID=1940636 RepID=UPI003AAA99FC
MKIKVVLLLVATGIMFGCSDENKVVRGEFLAGCVQGGAPKSVCSCTFEKLEDKYTPDELKQLSRSMAMPSQKFLKDVMNFAMECRDE